MRLINTTSSHSELVRNQLRNTDTKLVETYSAGNYFHTSAKTLRAIDLKQISRY